MVAGERYRRRQPAGDEFDVVIVRGTFNDEVVISPATFGQPVACTPESFVEAYARVLPEDDERDNLADRLAALEEGS